MLWITLVVFSRQLLLWLTVTALEVSVPAQTPQMVGITEEIFSRHF